MKNLLIQANIFYNMCNIIKTAFIKKVPGGWRVMSEKGKNLGTYKTKEEAKKRLRQIEYFKHKKADDQSIDLTQCNDFSYSSILRELRKKADPKILKRFLVIYKKNFDNAILQEKDKPESMALIAALNELIEDKNILISDKFIKSASAIELGNPEYAGKYLSDIMKFVMQRISKENRPRSLHSLKNKIMAINENEIANKKVPNSAAIGQCITFLKHILLNHNPMYIRQVINNIAKHLV